MCKVLLSLWMMMTLIALVEQPIQEAVITVPAFFNQAERRSVLRAGEMAGLKVLQLMNANTAGEVLHISHQPPNPTIIVSPFPSPLSPHNTHLPNAHSNPY